MSTLNVTGGIVEYAYPGDVLTYAAGAAIDGGQMVELTATDLTVQEAGAESAKCVGVALHTAASGEKLSVARVGVYYLKAAGAISGGDLVECAADGDVAKHDNVATPSYLHVIGIALEDISNGNRGRVALRLG
jgi:hypothetical protein